MRHPLSDFIEPNESIEHFIERIDTAEQMEALLDCASMADRIHLADRLWAEFKAGKLTDKELSEYAKYEFETIIKTELFHRHSGRKLADPNDRDLLVASNLNERGDGIICFMVAGTPCKGAAMVEYTAGKVYSITLSASKGRRRYMSAKFRHFSTRDGFLFNAVESYIRNALSDGTLAPTMPAKQNGADICGPLYESTGVRYEHEL